MNLSWNDISSEEYPYDYQLLRRENGGEWISQSMWDGKETINVLNVYPQNEYLETWMKEPLEELDIPAGKDLMNISSVYFEDFNSAPGTCLYDENGKFRYDVIYFDGDNVNDLTDEAYSVVRSFSDSGRGILFGHDTISYMMIGKKKNCNSYADDLGLIIKPSYEPDWNGITSVNVVKKGVMTSFPWELNGTLTIPGTHTSGQYNLSAAEWMLLDKTRQVDQDTGAEDSFYLVTKNNLGMIQTGHSRGQASDDERKVLANTLFYLFQRAAKTEATDFCLFDTEAPEKPEIISQSSKDGSLSFSVKSEDKGTVCEYMTKGLSRDDVSNEICSNIFRHEVVSGLAGFVIRVSDKRTVSPELVEFDENGNAIGLVSPDENGKADLSVTPGESADPRFIHIFAIDKVNNISYETVIPVSEHLTDLKLGCSVSLARNEVALSWNNISSRNSTFNYEVLRRTNDGEWETISAWDRKNKISVLNVYPVAPYLESWMTEPLEGEETSAGKDLIDVKSVYFKDFNASPESYMCDEDGNFIYDVVFFGSADCNGGFDLNEESYEVTRRFADSGRGVLFGHDTICGSLQSICQRPNFNKFAEDTGLYVKYNELENGRSTTAIAAKNGVLNNYPWTLGKTISIPSWHSSNQYCLDGTEWFVLDGDRLTDEDTGAKAAFYLVTKNNFGLIQTGNSNGQATDDEKKVLANTLFYLYQRTPANKAVDSDYYDRNAPTMPEKINSTRKDNKLTVTVEGRDAATVYEYYIKAVSETDNIDDVKSNIIKRTAESGVAGFVVKVTDTLDSARDLIEYEDDNYTVKDISPTYGNGKRAKIEIELDDSRISQCVHIFTVDKANNISEELILPIVADIKLGDVDLDGDVDSVDASMVLGEYARLSVNEPYSFSEKQFAAGDIDENGILDAVDASSILAYYAYMATDGKLDDMREWLKLPAAETN